MFGFGEKAFIYVNLAEIHISQNNYKKVYLYSGFVYRVVYSYGSYLEVNSLCMFVMVGYMIFL